jgi:hypothetical protein
MAGEINGEEHMTCPPREFLRVAAITFFAISGASSTAAAERPIVSHFAFIGLHPPVAILAPIRDQTPAQRIERRPMGFRQASCFRYAAAGAGQLRQRRQAA